MKIAPAKVQSFLERPDGKIYAALIYGPNAGLVEWSAEKLTATLKAGAFKNADEINISMDDLKENPARLEENLSNLSLFVTSKIITVKNAADALTKQLDKDVLKRLDSSTYLIVTADNLTPKSSLRKLFEAGDITASIACYDETDAQLKAFAGDYLKRAGFTADQEALRALTESGSLDRAVLAQELDKLMLYAYPATRIKADDVLDVSTGSGEFAFDEFNAAVIAGNIPAMLDNIAQGGYADYQSITLIKGAVWHLNRLIQVKVEMESGSGFEEAIAVLKPPLFFKSVQDFRKQVDKRPLPALFAMLRKLLEAEIRLKKSLQPQNIDITFADLVIRA